MEQNENANKELSSKQKKKLVREQERRIFLAKNANEIRKQGDLIRDMKAKSEDKNAPEILAEVFKLLSLKLSDPELSVKTQAIKNSNTKCITKLRWKIRKDDGTTDRLQHVFTDKPFFTASELATIISSHTLKQTKYPHLGGFTKIEVVVSKENKDKKNETKGIYKSLRPNDRVELPLLFPGPTFPDVHIQDIRVTWSISPTPQNTPKDYPNIRPYIVDIGVNLFDKELYHNINSVIYNANASGIAQMIAISTTLDNSVNINLPLCQKHVNTIFATIGVHPNEASTWKDEETENKIVEALNKDFFIAIGECGLDYLKEDLTEDDKKKQAFIFEKQLQIAVKYKMPVFLHERKAHKEFVEILSKYRSQLTTVLVNCFTGPLYELEMYNKLDCFIGVTGILGSEDRGENLRKVLKDIPLNRLVLGSDAPYLTPFNMPRDELGRFPKCNEPQYLPFTLSLAASLLNVSVEHLANITTQNARELFKVPELLYNGTSRTSVKQKEN